MLTPRLTVAILNFLCRASETSRPIFICFSSMRLSGTLEFLIDEVLDFWNTHFSLN